MHLICEYVKTNGILYNHTHTHTTSKQMSIFLAFNLCALTQRGSFLPTSTLKRNQNGMKQRYSAGRELTPFMDATLCKCTVDTHGAFPFFYCFCANEIHKLPYLYQRITQKSSDNNTSICCPLTFLLTCGRVEIQLAVE